MTSTVQPQPAIATGAAHWDVGGYRIWESTDPDVLLYVRHALTLASDAAGRPIASITRALAWDGTGYVPTGGTAVLGLLGADPDDAAVLLSLQDAWNRVLRAGGRGGPDPRYRPLPLRDVTLAAQLDPAEAVLTAVPAGTTLQVQLTAAGAVAWAGAVGGGGPVAGTVRLGYSYPQVLPAAMALVQVHGRRVYAQLATALHVAPNGELSGTAAEVTVAWTGMVASGAVEVSVSGSPSGSAARMRDDLIEQVRENLFDTMFVLCPGATMASPTYALRWTRPDDVPDLPLAVTVEGGPTWLTETLEAGVAQLLARLDAGAVHDVLPSVAVPVTVVVDRCEAVGSVAVSLDFGDVRPPEAVTFGPEGGSRTFTVTTDRPDRLAVRGRTQVDFAVPAWPVLTYEGPLAAPPTLLVKPEAWLRRHRVVAVVARDGRVVTDPWPQGDVLTLNVRYENPALPAGITETARIAAAGPVAVIVPVPPGAPAGRLTVTALGSLGGNLASACADIGTGDADVTLLVEDRGLRFITGSTTLPESDPVGERLRAARGRPIVRREALARPESGRDIDVGTGVFLVPQPTTVSCWAAALAMVIGARDRVSVTPAAVAGQADMNLDTGYGWARIQDAVTAWGLVDEGPLSMPPADWAASLKAWGPIWVVEVGAPFHAVVVTAVRGDGTPDGTWVRLHNPWPPGIGRVKWTIFSEFDQEFGLGAGSAAAMVHG